MFVVNSRLGTLLCDRLMLRLFRLHNKVATLIPKLRVHFAEFLNEGSPAHLRFSPRIPVSVYGTGGNSLTRSFSRQCGVSGFAPSLDTPHHASDFRNTDLPMFHPTRFYTGALPFACLPALLCHSIAQTITTGTGISASCPSPTLHVCPD